MILLAALCGLAACSDGRSASPGGTDQDFASWAGIAEALNCTYVSEPVHNPESGQQRSICRANDNDTTFVTVSNVEDPQQAKALFGALQQTYTFVSEKWALVGDAAVIEEAARKAGAEVHKPGDSRSSDADLKMPKVGEPFDYQAMNAEGPGAAWQVTLDKVDCGQRSLPEAASNPEWDGSEDSPQYVDAEPDAGTEFCVLQWNWENVGKTPGAPDQAGDALVGDERHTRSTDDQDRSWTMMETRLDVAYTDQVKPGASTKSLDVYQVKAGQEMDAVAFPQSTVMYDSWILVTHLAG